MTALLFSRAARAWHRAAWAIALVLPALSALAAPPDAGQILNEQQQALPKPMERLPQPETRPQPLPQPVPGQTSVVVKAVNFTGGDALATPEEFQGVVADAIGRELDFAGLQEVADRVTGYLKAKGYPLAFAYLPTQTLEDGILHVTIQSGRVEGKLSLKPEGLRIAPEVLTEIVGKALLRDGPDAPAHTEQLERGLLLLNDLPGVAARGILEPGTEPGTSRLIIDASEGSLVNGIAWLDNYGGRYTGVWRANLQMEFNDPFGIGDQITAQLSHTWGIDQSSLGYRLPIGVDGLQADFRTGTMSYRIGADLVDLDARGGAHTAHAGLKYPLLRSRNRSLWASVSYDYKHQQDELLGITFRDRRAQAITAGLTGELRDDWGGGALSTASVSVTGGKVSLHNELDEWIDGLSSNNKGRYAKGNASLTRLQNITGRLALFGGVNAQIASTNLDSAERFMLGGPNGVRAYPLGEGNGDNGWTATAELRYALDLAPLPFCEFVAFLDTGLVKRHRGPWANSVFNSESTNRYQLSGAGVGLNLATQQGLSVRTQLAFPVGPNPGRDRFGDNIDGQRDRARIWLQVAARF